MAKERNGHTDVLHMAFKARRAAEAGVPPDDDAVRTAYPNLFDIMTRLLVEKGIKALRAGRVEVENCVGQWLFKIHYAPIGGWKEVLVNTWDAGLPALEQALLDQRVPWRFYSKLKEIKVKEDDPKKKSALEKMNLDS